MAGRLVREAGWQVLRGPGIHVDRAEVALRVADRPDDAQLHDLNERLVDETGYRLVVET